MIFDILLNFSLIYICRTVRLPALMKAVTAVTKGVSAPSRVMKQDSKRD